MFRHNNFASGLCLSIVALTATMCLYNVSRGDEFIERKKAPKHQYQTFLHQYLPTPLKRSDNLWLWCNKNLSWSISSNSTRMQRESATMVQQNFHYSIQAPSEFRLCNRAGNSQHQEQKQKTEAKPWLGLLPAPSNNFLLCSYEETGWPDSI